MSKFLLYKDMNLEQERDLLVQLEFDEARRNRIRFDYTGDALREGGILPLSIYPESNQNVVKVIKEDVDYNSLPLDKSNDLHKGWFFTEQQDIILRNWGKEILCEAQDMNPCLKDDCELYHSDLGPPICSEFKMAFRR